MDFSNVPENTPIVFISYSWSVSNKVMQLTDRLYSDGIHVVMDKIDLIEGNDKYDFMEQCVKNDRISKVLMICDKTYADKANNRVGGVGEEALIISPEIYQNTRQDKFIPIVFDYNDNGVATLPHYLKTRIYIDLYKDDSYEYEYNRLIRLIHNEREYRRPQLGKKPDFTHYDNLKFSRFKTIHTQFKSSHYRAKNRQKMLLINSIDKYIDFAKEFTIYNDEEFVAELFEKLEIASLYKGDFIDFLRLLAEEDIDIAEAFTKFVTKFYNTYIAKPVYRNTMYSYKVEEIFSFILKDLCISTTAFCLHYEKYKDLHTIITHNYFLEDTNNQGEYYSFSKFRNPCSSIKLLLDKLHNKKSIGELMTKYEYLPILSADKIKEADMLLYILGACNVIPNHGMVSWYPETYNNYSYTCSVPIEVKKLQSKKFCELFFTLFNVKTVEEFKNLINEAQRIHGLPLVSSIIQLDSVSIIN